MNVLRRIISRIILPSAFGLDISDYSVKFVKFSRTRGGFLSLTSFGETPLPKGIVVAGEVQDVSGLAEALKTGLKDSSGKLMRDPFVVATLPEEKSFVHLIQLPLMKEEDIGKAARWELEGIVPLPVDELYFDYTLLSVRDKPADHMDILVTAFPKATVESYVSSLTAAGFTPVALELESQAILRALRQPADTACIFVDVGATRTSSFIAVGGLLLFTLSIPLGGADIDHAIGERLGVSLKEAGELKKKFGLSETYQDGALYEALVPLLSALAGELKKQIMFYREHSLHRHGLPEDVSTVILSGGDANLEGLGRYLSVTLKREVRLGNPLEQLLSQKKFRPPFSKNQSLRYTAAVGSALRGVEG